MLTATVCVALSGAGLAMAVLTGWRRRFRRAVRTAAVALLPIGLYMAGLVTLFRKVGLATGHWAADLVLKPTVWMGFAVLAVAVVLYLASRLGAGRSEEGGADRDEPAAVGSSPRTSARAIPPAGRAADAGPKRKKGSSAAGSEFDDIEEILRKRGI